MSSARGGNLRMNLFRFRKITSKVIAIFSWMTCQMQCSAAPDESWEYTCLRKYDKTLGVKYTTTNIFNPNHLSSTPPGFLGGGTYTNQRIYNKTTGRTELFGERKSCCDFHTRQRK